MIAVKLQATKKRRFRGAFRVATSVMPEQCQQQNDRQRHAKQPKQSTSSKTHDFFLLMHRPDDAGGEKKFRASKRRGMRPLHGLGGVMRADISR
ncbi:MULTISPECIES: hypothetical protein [unclassified Bradyrhizobium]|uniref:hypothetical protein n=1 Tax=unclassified Bradyrhizobium TaxID=2631580 RepID=UPI0021199C0E|nr:MULTISPECIES: hypothetical protein [unclassified Bradyrhizobium]